MKIRNQKLLYLLLFFSVIGLLASVYLTDLHYKTESSNAICDINSKVSCTNLAQSKYSLFAGVPIAVLGIFGYIAFLGNTVSLFFKPNFDLLKRSLFALTTIALVFTVYLVFIEFKIGIFCLGCLVSQLSTLSIFILSYFLLRSN